MVKIRLAKHGKKHDPFYRIVVIDGRKKNIGQPLAVVGHWQPKKELKEIDKKAIQAWIKQGAQISPAVKKLLK